MPRTFPLNVTFHSGCSYPNVKEPTHYIVSPFGFFLLLFLMKFGAFWFIFVLVVLQSYGYGFYGSVCYLRNGFLLVCIYIYRGVRGLLCYKQYALIWLTSCAVNVFGAAFFFFPFSVGSLVSFLTYLSVLIQDKESFNHLSFLGDTGMVSPIFLVASFIMLFIMIVLF